MARKGCPAWSVLGRARVASAPGGLAMWDRRGLPVMPWGLLREHLEIYNGDNLETEVHRMLKEASLVCAFC